MSARTVAISRKVQQYVRKHSVSPADATAIIAPYRAGQLQRVAERKAEAAKRTK